MVGGATRFKEYIGGATRFKEYIGGATRFKEYIRLKRMDGVWGDDPEIQAICELYDRPVARDVSATFGPH